MIFTMACPMTYKCYPFETWRGYCRHPHLTHTYQYCNIQVARGNDCFHEIIRIIKLCDWPKRSPRVKSVMAQYLKIHFMRYTNYVQSFILLSKSAQFLLCRSTTTNNCTMSELTMSSCLILLKAYFT